MIKPVVVWSFTAFLGLAMPATQAQVNSRLIAMNCLSCHDSEASDSDGDILNLNKFTRAKLLQALLDFKYGNKSATLMPRLLKGYADNELAAIAELLAHD